MLALQLLQAKRCHDEEWMTLCAEREDIVNVPVSTCSLGHRSLAAGEAD